MPLYPMIWVAVYYMILASSRAKNSKKEHPLAHLAVAWCIWFINPVRFVDSPAYVRAARRINRHIAVARFAEYSIIFAGILAIYLTNEKFPESCVTSKDMNNVQVVDFIVTHNWLLCVAWLLMWLLHRIVCCFGPLSF